MNIEGKRAITVKRGSKIIVMEPDGSRDEFGDFEFAEVEYVLTEDICVYVETDPVTVEQTNGQSN